MDGGRSGDFLLKMYYFVFKVMNIIFPYDFILISLNNRIIRLFFETKN